ncbi:MAG: DNA helicase PcrA [Bifidobacteriaceae bacterium]|jgi:DNA helicase-2/ATP-dependent DNA helicase PcrA|nr:DNA helicase PcrA [Bifidobacteriaceae bacterium]
MEQIRPALLDLSRLPSLAPAAWGAAEDDPTSPFPSPAGGRRPGAAGGGRTASDTENVDRLLDDLNAEQKAAVTHAGTPLLIVAGAGSGKTRVLTRRIAHLLATGRARPGEILAITFTNKAAAEMRERVEHLVGRAARYMWVSTFHSACVRILRREAAHLGLKSSFSIYDAQDSTRLITMVCRELGLDAKKFPPRQLANRISNLKNELVDPESYSSRVAGLNPVEDATAQVYRVYQQRLQSAHALDFDDLIMQTVNLLEVFPDVADQYHRRFRHILVDEYQDTNHAQYLLVRELAGIKADALGGRGHEPAELTVVGDSDQSIYAFRGATVRNITEFETDYPDATTIMLEQNYRSTQNILTAANGVIAKNHGRRAKRLWTAEGAGPKVVGYVADSEHDEAQFIAKEIDSLGDEHGVKPRQVAVFYRTNAQSRALEEVFIRTGIPYRVVGGTRFYERREVRDAIAYLRAAANIDDTVSLRRIFNVPKRGLGDRSEAAVQAHAARKGISFGAALGQADEIGDLTPRARSAIAALGHLLAALAEMSAEGAGPAQILDYALDESGYLAELQGSRDPQDLGRVENLAELHAVASEFEQVSPEGSLADFLERVSLVADSDQLPPEAADGAVAGAAAGAAGAADAAKAAAEARDQGQVTLMTLHTAKGLEFPVVFLTGFEDGTFPHQRSMADPQELAEERRLAYVGLTRARRRLYISRAEARTTFGRPEYYPASRFIFDIPAEVIEWRRERGSAERLFGQGGSWGGGQHLSDAVGAGSRAGRGRAQGGQAADGPSFGSASPRPAQDVPNLKPGDLVTHDKYGLGTVTAVEGAGLNQVARIDFRADGVKRLLLRFAPVTKL